MIPIVYLISLGVSALLCIVLPIVAVALVRRRLELSWRYALYGALIFTLFQLVTRVPAVFALQSFVAPRLQASQTLQIAWLAGLSLSAGLFEEIGRFIGYRWLMREEEKTWPKAVLYGLGHGGIESIVLVGGLQLLTLVNLSVLSTVDLNTLPLTPEQRQQTLNQIAAIAALPGWLPLAGLWERIWSVCFHVAMSVVVLQAFRRGPAVLWVGLAIGLHFLTNFLGAGAPLLFGVSGPQSILLSEAIITVVGLGSLWVIWRLRGA
jgi:uncharacterized membrane protein YhfC